jgi:hypothetical protein
MTLSRLPALRPCRSPSRFLRLPALSVALLLPTLLGTAACGEEAPLPIVPGTSGAQSSGGVTVIPTGGMSGSVSSSGSSAQPTGGTGVVMPAGGSDQGGMSTGGTGTTGGTGPSGGGGGASGGSSQAGTGGGGSGDLKEAVAGKLNGFMLLGPCLKDSAKSVCQTSNNGCPGDNNQDFPLSGVLTTDKTITLGGDPAKTYTITLHIQGVVEAKAYDGTQDQSAQGASPKGDGFAVGGTPTKGDYYNVYMVRVNSPKQDYFLNSLNPPGVSNHTTYGIDYSAKVKANGGAMLRLVAADRNCSMIKNCGPQVNDGSQCTAPITLQGVDAVAVSKNPTFAFNQAFNGQWIVMVVTDVTEG